MTLQFTAGFASGAPPGTYTSEGEARSWTGYGSTFTEGDVEGQATMTIDPPDLRLGDASWITHAIGMSQGSGWSKTSGGEPFFSFEVEVLNTGNETVGTFKVGLLYLDGNPVGIDVGLFWTGSEWDIDADETTATGAELRERITAAWEAEPPERAWEMPSLEALLEEKYLNREWIERF